MPKSGYLSRPTSPTQATTSSATSAPPVRAQFSPCPPISYLVVRHGPLKEDDLYYAHVGAPLPDQGGDLGKALRPHRSRPASGLARAGGRGAASASNGGGRSGGEMLRRIAWAMTYPGRDHFYPMLVIFIVPSDGAWSGEILVSQSINSHRSPATRT